MFTKIRPVLALMTLLVLVTACGDDGGDGGEGEAAATADEAPEWAQHEAPEGCQCADGSEFSYWSRTASTDKVVLYFQGGGACFTPETCSFEDGTYTVQADASGLTATGDDAPTGIFDFENEANPFRDWSFVFVPYCTGDVHLGNAVHEYTEDLSVNHVGFLNAKAGVDHLVETFPDASEVFVTGSSAGGVPSPLMAGLLSDELPETEIAVLADASGAYPDNPTVNSAIGSLWGTFENVPDWPENEGLTAEDWSIPGLFVQSGLHDPDIRMARYDNAYDETQQTFTSLANLAPGEDLLSLIQGNEAGIEADGVPIHSYTAAGTEHTILGDPLLYTLETDGVSFLDWLTRYIEGEDVDDVVCTDCGEPAAGAEG